MTETETFDLGARTVSPLLERSEIRLAANVTATAVLQAGRFAAFALGDGAIHLREIGKADGKPVFEGGGITAASHAGAATALEPFRNGFVSAGHDGRVVLWRDTNSGLVPLFDFGGRWVDALAVQESRGAIAAAAGCRVVVVDQSGHLTFDSHEFPSTVSGLSFAPEGRRLAAAHLDGVSILSFEGGVREHFLEWKGSHIGVSWSPDGRYVVSATQERELHVWDLVTLQDLRLGGYPHKIHGMHWLSNGPHLVCTGADVITAWSFADAGPAGKPPIEIGYVYAGLVTAVAANPVHALVAGGYSTGSLLLGGVAKGKALVARPSQGDAITALSWSSDGRRLIAGTAAGDAVVVAVPEDLTIR